MALSRRILLATAAASASLPLSPARAAQRPLIRLGVLNDQSGVYADDAGPTSVVCARQAVQDFGDHGFDVEILVGDHQNKPDVGASIARQWLDQGGVDAIVDVPTSSVALAVNTICRERNKVFLNSGAGTADLTGSQCSLTTIHWTYDTYMLSNSTGGAMMAAGGDSWFFITADYVFGQQLDRDTAALVTRRGGKVLGRSAYPFPDTRDFSSMLVQAQASGAKVLGLANAGADTINCIKQAHEFGLNSTMKIAALLGSINDVHTLGLETAQGLLFTESFYWDLNNRTRAFSARARPKLAKPSQLLNMVAVGNYGSVMHYLKATADLGPAAAKASGRDVVARMKAMPTDDDAFGPGRIREDGRKLHPAYLLQAKTPQESKNDWDLLKLVATTPADEAFRPLAEGHCAFIKA
jgi:branched-chain amino acid transport system substrate-binding protein